MVDSVRRFIVFIVSTLFVSITLAAGAGPALAAAPAPAIQVGSAPQCPKAAFRTIQAAITAAPTVGGRITVCAGTYPERLLVTGKTNLTIIGKKGAKLVPEFTPFNGDLVLVDHSTNVTFQGFTIDGRGQLDPLVDAQAIVYSDASGLIAKNTVLNWHTPGFAADDQNISAIQVISLGTPSVTVKNNTITTFQSNGISVQSGGLMTITGNRISTTGHSENEVFGIAIQPSPTTPAHGLISRNRLDIVAPSGDILTEAISIQENGPFQVVGNTTHNFGFGVGMISGCKSMDGLQVKNNKINEAGLGIILQLVADMPCGDIHANNLVITGNRVINKHEAGEIGIGVVAQGDNGAQAAVHNALVKGNSVTNFQGGVGHFTADGGVVDGIFTPNKVHLDPIFAVSH